MPEIEVLAEGQRVARFLVVRDVDGRRHAVSASAVAALCEMDDGTLLLLPGGRLIHVPQTLDVVVHWLAG